MNKSTQVFQPTLNPDKIGCSMAANPLETHKVNKTRSQQNYLSQNHIL